MDFSKGSSAHNTSMISRHQYGSYFDKDSIVNQKICKLTALGNRSPIIHPCTYIHFSTYYFGNNKYIRESKNTSIVNPSAMLEFHHGDYHTQISDALKM